jgi:hypothetical protein
MTQREITFIDNPPQSIPVSPVLPQVSDSGKSDQLPDNAGKRKETQLERVFEFIKAFGKTATWDLENWARSECLAGNKTIMGGSATRHARTLCKLGRIEHPKKENGQVDKHRYIVK